MPKRWFRVDKLPGRVEFDEDQRPGQDEIMEILTRQNQNAIFLHKVIISALSLHHQIWKFEKKK